MKIEQTSLPGVFLIEPKVFADDRGFFYESYNSQRYQDHQVSTNFVQDNHARSSRGVLRGLHYQLRSPQAKLVSVGRGEVFDVAVDIRRGSPTFGRWWGTILSDQNHRQVFIPEGFAHGYCVISEIADFFYKCSDFYVPDDQHGVAWNDPELGIDWPITDPVLSDKDRVNAPLADISPELLPPYEESR